MYKESKSLNHFIVPAINEMVHTLNRHGWNNAKYLKQGQQAITDAAERYFRHKNGQYMSLLERIVDKASKGRDLSKRGQKIYDGLARNKDLWLKSHDGGGLVYNSRIPIVTTKNLNTFTPLFRVDHNTGRVTNFLKEPVSEVEKVNKWIRNLNNL